MQDKVFDSRGQGCVDRGINRVRARASPFGHNIGKVINDIAFVPRQADQRIRTQPAIQRIAKTGAGDPVGRLVAGPVPGRARRSQVFKVQPQRQIHRRDDPIGAAACGLVGNIRSHIYVIGMVARTANHPVSIAAAVQRIAARRAPTM